MRPKLTDPARAVVRRADVRRRARLAAGRRRASLKGGGC